MRHVGFLRNFEAVLRELARRGHETVVAVEVREKSRTALASVMRDLEATGQISFAEAPQRRNDPRHQAVTRVRAGLDYLRYLEPRYEDKPKLRGRAAKAAPAAVRALVGLPGARTTRGRAAIGEFLAALEVAAPASADVETFLARQHPDLVLITPLVELGSPQTDFVRAARAAGIPTCLGVASWDNLTVKGTLREWPDLVAVWNAAQIREAHDLHGVPPDRLTATGAHTYDHWFAWRPLRDRDAFCDQVGLPPDRPYLLYLCSSPFIAPDEAGFVRDWITGLRGSEQPSLREAGVLVRPHPQNAKQWADVDLHDGAAVIWPRAGADPVERSSRQDFFESIYHSAAVVGVNTSALIESAIVGRPVLAAVDERLANGQAGTLHFDHLARDDGGILTVARTASEHRRQLADALEGRADEAARRERFLHDFVRPHGLEEPSATRFVDALEAACSNGTRAAPPPPRIHPAVLRVLRAWWRSSLAERALVGVRTLRWQRSFAVDWPALPWRPGERPPYAVRRTRRAVRHGYRRARTHVGALLGRTPDGVPPRDSPASGDGPAGFAGTREPRRVRSGRQVGR